MEQNTLKLFCLSLWSYTNGSELYTKREDNATTTRLQWASFGPFLVHLETERKFGRDHDAVIQF